MKDARVFVLRVRHEGKVEEATADTVLREGDVVAVAGARDVLVKAIGEGANEIDDPELLNVPVEGVDVYVTNSAVDGKTLAELAKLPGARGVFLRKIVRGATATSIPVLPNTQVQRGDILTVVGRTQDTDAVAKLLGAADRPTDVSDVAFIGAGITVGALIGALVLKMGGVPLTLSTAGGALVAGLVLGWLRSVRPAFGRIPSPTVWFMNNVGLNIFIAIVGISAGPGFIDGLKTQGASLFLGGSATTSRSSSACSSASSCSASTMPCCSASSPGANHDQLRLVCDAAKSQIRPSVTQSLRGQNAAHDLGYGAHPSSVLNGRSRERKQ